MVPPHSPKQCRPRHRIKAGFSPNSHQSNRTGGLPELLTENPNEEPANDEHDEHDDSVHEHEYGPINRNWVPNTQYKKQQNIIRKQKVSVVFNYSSITLTNDMESILNRGFNFAILPLGLDITQILVDFKRFERSIIWQEYFYGRESDNERKENIFKIQKYNLPRNYNIPDDLKNYLNSVKSDLIDPKLRNKIDSNIPASEMRALKDLIQLQKDRKITIKPCYKGAGIMILNFEEYLRACMSHLESTQTQPNGEESPYYEKVTEEAFKEAQDDIQKLLEEGYNNEYITKEDFDAMKPVEKTPGKFYCTLKVHKPHSENKALPERPIISGSGSITENPSLFVEYHLKDLATKHDTFIQDTPDFETINQEERRPAHAVLVTLDITGLFTNIPQDDSTQTAWEALSERENKRVPTEYLIRLLDLIHKNNIFEFNSELYSQKIGGAMGQRHVPHTANLFLARRLDNKIKQIAKALSEDETYPIKFMNRFLDDLFKIYNGSTANLHKLLEDINKIHPNIKFTMTHTTPNSEPETSRCSCPPKESVQFLDTSCSLKEGRIIVDLYRKPTDRNQYLLTSSCHPETHTENIPFSLALRIVRPGLLRARDKRPETAGDAGPAPSQELQAWHGGCSHQQGQGHPQDQSPGVCGPRQTNKETNICGNL